MVPGTIFFSAAPIFLSKKRSPGAKSSNDPNSPYDALSVRLMTVITIAWHDKSILESLLSVIQPALILQLGQLSLFALPICKGLLDFVEYLSMARP